MTKNFNIKYRPEIESGKYKVRTSGGRSVRIVCWDAKSEFNEPVVALVNYDGKEVAVNYTEDGRYIGNKDNYLVIEDGCEKTRWEGRVREILEKTASLTETANALYLAAQRENYDRMLDSVHEFKVRTNSTPEKEYYGQ